MPTRQYYYTSYVNKQTGSAGFQVKALSPGLSADLQVLLPHLISYRIPPSCDAYALSSHPIALRYLPRGPHASIMLTSQSCGSDELGRPGNFFAHALVLDEMPYFQSVPPICFWESPFWRNSDPEEHSELPVLSLADIPYAFDEARIWSFLAHGERCKLLVKLLSAIVHSASTQRRIIILDSSEQVALWIAAVSWLLPPAYRPLLSFATYHHDPYQTQYLITGTTHDSSFRASPADYQSSFILDEISGTTSNIASSAYAEMVIEAANQEDYTERLLPLFQHYAPLFPPATTIDEQLDRLALYAQTQLSPSRSTLPPIESVLALPTYELTHEQVCTIQARLTDLPLQDYQHSIERYLPALVQQTIAFQTHLLVLQSLFLQKEEYAFHFWHIYLQSLADQLMQPSTIEHGMALLDDWWTLSPQDDRERYMVQGCLLSLPSAIEQHFKQHTRTKKEYQVLLHALHSTAAKRLWYPALQHALPDPSMPMLNVLTAWQNKRRVTREQMQWLFSGDDIAERHHHSTSLYFTAAIESFWPDYWLACKQQLLLSRETERVPRILAWLSFWFDSSFELLDKKLFLPQGFFLGLGRVLQEVASDRLGRETLSQIQQAEEAKQLAWYPLIARYLTER